MRAIQVSKTGGPDALSLVELPKPQPKPNEAVVKIAASGVNFIDVYFREGRYPAPLPFVNGQEAAGVVSDLGSDVKSLKAGDHVAYCGVLGSYAEYAAVPADRLVRVPQGVSDRDAAAAMLQGMTAHYLVKDSFRLQSGQTALIHAAAGGVGLLLVQMCKQAGAQVIATVGTEDKAALARGAGADHVILYSQQDFEAETRRIMGGKGVDVVYDGVGKSTFEKDLNVLRPRGYVVLFGASSGAVPPFDLLRLSQKGSLYVTRPTLKDYIASREDLERRAGDVLGWVASGSLKLRVGKEYRLDDAAQAHRDLESRNSTGKLVLIP